MLFRFRIGLMNGLHSCAALELEGLSQASSDILGFPASVVGISFPEVESAEEERVPQFKRLREIAEELRKSKAPLEPDYTEKSAANATADTDQKSKAKADRESLQVHLVFQYAAMSVLRCSAGRVWGETSSNLNHRAVRRQSAKQN